MYRGQVTRIQRRLAALLSKYLLLDNWKKIIKSKQNLTDQQRHQVKAIYTKMHEYYDEVIGIKYVCNYGSFHQYATDLWAPILNQCSVDGAKGK